MWFGNPDLTIMPLAHLGPKTWLLPRYYFVSKVWEGTTLLYFGFMPGEWVEVWVASA